MDNNIETAMAEANPVSAVVFAGTFLGLGYAAVLLSGKLGFEQTASLAAAAIVCVFYFGWLLLKRNGAVVDDAIDKANEAIADADEKEKSIIELLALASAYQAKLNSAQSQVKEMQSLQLELQTLKEQKQLVDENLRTTTDRNIELDRLHKAEEQLREKQKQAHEIDLANAKTAGEQAVETAKANAKKSYAPALKVAEAYLSYAQGRSISNNNSLDASARERGKEMAAVAKALLDEFVASASAKTATA